MIPVYAIAHNSTALAAGLFVCTGICEVRV